MRLTSLCFSWNDAQDWVFWWEVLEMFRRFFLVGMMSIVLGGSLVQIVIATLFCIFYLILQLQVMPFKDLFDDYVALACTSSLTVLFFSCVVLKIGVLTDVPEVDEVLPPRLRESFKVPSAVLSVVIFSSVICSLVFMLLIAIFQTHRERKRQLIEERDKKARRLVRKADNGPALPLALADGQAHHLFLSHVWSTAQDQVRIIHTRLKDMMPEVSVFLDVEDLEDISDLEGYIERSQTVLVMCTKGYFQSKNCMRELRYAVHMGKPLIAVLDLDSDIRSLTVNEVHAELLKADENYGKWGFKRDGLPTGAACFSALFVHDALEWNRIGTFQDVTMRLIAERLLPSGYGSTYLMGESIQAPIELPPPRRGRSFHVYVSSNNPSAFEFASEVDDWLMLRQNTRKGTLLKVCTDFEAAGKCEAMLLYLNALTWTNGLRTAALANEIAQAMSQGMPILLAHEMPGLGGQDERHGVAFGSFFDSSATPMALIKAGIYGTIAVALKGGPWRDASMVEMVKAIGKLAEWGEPAEINLGSQAALHVEAITQSANDEPESNEEPVIATPSQAGGSDEVQKLRTSVRRKSVIDVFRSRRSHLMDDEEQHAVHDRRRIPKPVRLPPPVGWKPQRIGRTARDGGGTTSRGFNGAGNQTARGADGTTTRLAHRKNRPVHLAPVGQAAGGNTARERPPTHRTRRAAKEDASDDFHLRTNPSLDFGAGAMDDDSTAGSASREYQGRAVILSPPVLDTTPPAQLETFDMASRGSMCMEPEDTVRPSVSRLTAARTTRRASLRI